MIDLFPIYEIGSYSNKIIIISNITDIAFIWMFFIFVCLIITVIVIFLLYKSSKTPEELVHNPFTKKDSYPGLLNDLSNSIKSDKKLNQYKSSIRNSILMMFFQKIEDKRDITTDELLNMKKNKSNKLYDIIKDEDIVNWILKLDNKEKGKLKRINKERYIEEINFMIDKMEEWGE